MEKLLKFACLLSCILISSCEPKILENRDRAMNEKKLGEIINRENDKLLKLTSQKIDLLSKSTKKYLNTLTEEDRLNWQEAWRSAHESFLAITFLPIKKKFSQIEAWPLSPGFLDSLENYPYSGIVNDSTIQITPEVLKTQHMITDPSEISLGFHVLEYYAFERNSEDLNGSEEIKKRRRSLISVVSDLLVEEIKKLENEPHKKLETSYPELIAHMKDKVQGIHIEIRSAEHCVYSRSSDEIVKYQLMIFNEIFKNTLEIDKYLEEISPDLTRQIVPLLKEVENHSTKTNDGYLEALIPKLIKIEGLLGNFETLRE